MSATIRTFSMTCRSKNDGEGYSGEENDGAQYRTDIKEGKDYRQLKDLISDRSR